MGKLVRSFLWIIAALSLCGPAAAQRLIVETTAYTALREAAGVYLHHVDLDRSEATPGPVAAPGPMGFGELVISPDGQTVALPTGLSAAGQEALPDRIVSYLSLYNASPLRALDGMPSDLPAGWRQSACCFVSDENGTPSLAILLSRIDAGGVGEGRFDVRPTLGPEGPALGPALSWPLPGAPVAAAALPGGRRVAVLCRGPLGSGAVLQARDAFSGEAVETVVAGAGGWGADPVSVRVSPGGRWIYVLVSGYAADRPRGDAASWLYRYDAARLEVSGKPLELPGLGEEPDALAVAADGGCWAATRDPSAGFAYATRALPGPDGLAAEAQVPFMEAGRPLRVAAAPTGPAVAVAVDERLEIWPLGKPGGATLSYAAPVAVLRWTPEVLVAGEGNRIHAFDALTGNPGTTVVLATGIVTGAALLPASSLPPADIDGDGVAADDERDIGINVRAPDTDADGIPDGVDPEPKARSPRLQLPPVVTFHGESVGQELRAVRIEPAFGAALEWRVDVDAAKAPWLTVYPRQGRTGEAFYMGVDQARYPADSGLLQAQITVHATGTRPQIPAAGSPGAVLVQVAPAPDEVPRALWLLDPAADALDGTSGGLDGLEMLLSTAPLRFEQRRETGPFAGALSPYRVVVVTAGAAVRGHVARQALLDYVAEGGAVLFLGRHMPYGTGAALERWLGPVGVYMDGGMELAGRFGTSRRDWLCRNWRPFEIQGGLGLHTANADAVLVPGPTGTDLAVLVAQPHGRGRVAALAASTPIENAALPTAENRRFAADLFRWLARIGTEYEDLDGDGLPDGVEDANGNGSRDPGETDRFLADSDGDCLGDGLEDLNRNGRVDEGESSPLNRDSDGDGVPDGADIEPLPPTEAPHVESVRPAGGPAEGGETVFVTGRNFGPDSVLWFGNRLATSVRRFGSTALAATIPPSPAPDGGEVAVRVANAESRLEGVLPNGYRYGPRSAVALTLHALRSAGAQYSGTISVRIEAPPEVHVGQMSVRIEAEPKDIRWTAVTAGTGAGLAGRRVEKRPAPTGGVWIDVSPPETYPGTGEIAQVEWRSSARDKHVGPVRVTLEGARAVAPNGEPLDVTVSGVVLGTAPETN